MIFDKDRMEDVLFEEWIKKNASFTYEKGRVFIELKKYVGKDLSLFYQMNKMITKGGGQVFDGELDLEFTTLDGISSLECTFGCVKLSNEDFRETIAALVDIYEDVYPLGSVVVLKKDVFRNIMPIDEVDELCVTITYRYVPYTDNSFIQYVGSIYPVGNMGIMKGDLHFTHKTVEKVLHRGYSDEREIAYLYQIKEKLIIENKSHSTGFLNEEDKKQVEKVLELSK